MPSSPRYATAAPRHQAKGTFRAPARGTFAPGGKSTQKRRSNLRFENPLRAFTCCLSCLLFPREHCAVQISPKCCIVSAPLSAAAFALKCRTVRFFDSRQELFSNGGQRPPLTFAAPRQRRDLIIAPSPGGCFQRGRAAAPPHLAVQGGGIIKGEGSSKLPSPFSNFFTKIPNDFKYLLKFFHCFSKCFQRIST